MALPFHNLRWLAGVLFLGCVLGSCTLGVAVDKGSSFLGNGPVLSLKKVAT